MKQLRLTDAAPSSESHGDAKPFLTDAAIASRLAEVEAALRAVICDSQERPYVVVGQAADDLRRLAKDLMPESQWQA